jgi:purine-binding chemotaxis protein CheW
MSTNHMPNGELQAVVFLLGSEAYGIDIFRVNEIIRLRKITPVPRTGSHIRGLVNLRGKTIPVVDLRARLHLSTREDGDETRIIVADCDQGNVGVIVDAVREVITLTPHQIEQAPPLVAGLNTEFVRGVAKKEDQLITLLDLDRALAA